ncbi:MAG: hypothetical protein NZ927_09815, partial [Candidatus Calescibacterium sp.]|nr:hypothetical protein [Candidatus Calescibacterium sp.]
IMLVFLKPFEVILFINRIREIFSKAESKFKPRVVRENFNINLPETYIYTPTLRYDRSKKVIRCCYDLPVSDDFIIWLFKEVEEEFLSFVEAYEEILQEQKTEEKQEKTQS